MLDSAELDKAVDEARAEPRVYKRVVRLAAASDGATPELIERSFGIADDAGIDLDTVWPTLALAVRTHRPHEVFLKQAKELGGDAAEPLLSVLQAKPQSAAELLRRAGAGMRPEQRAQASVMVAVLLGDAAPPATRELAKRALFQPERPYFR
jgi:RNAse (barnase) inhibitor barstar